MLGKIIEPCFAGRGVGHDGVKHVQRSDVDERDLVELTAVEDQDPRFSLQRSMDCFVCEWNSEESVTPDSRSMPLQLITALSTW